MRVAGDLKNQAKDFPSSLHAEGAGVSDAGFTALCDRDIPCGRRGLDHHREASRLGTRLDKRFPSVSWVLAVVEWIELS